MTDNRKFWLVLWLGVMLTIVALTTVVVVSESMETKRYLDKGFQQYTTYNGLRYRITEWHEKGWQPSCAKEDLK